MEAKQFEGKTIDDSITAATVELGVTSDKIKYEVVQEGSTGFLELFNKPAIIKVTLEESVTEKAQKYCQELFDGMDVETKVSIVFHEEENVMDINLEGPDMGILIGKRGQTLDALQYLISLYINRNSDAYIRVKLDTENYRERRKVTLEKLARKIASSVKRSRKPIALEPMNPYERRIIHSALQNDKYVCTKSEGEEPYRKVVIMLKRDNKSYGKSENTQK